MTVVSKSSQKEVTCVPYLLNLPRFPIIPHELQSGFPVFALAEQEKDFFTPPRRQINMQLKDSTGIATGLYRSRQTNSIQRCRVAIIPQPAQKFVFDPSSARADFCLPLQT